MSSRSPWLARAAVLCSISALCQAQDVPAEWSESQIVERFLSMSPQARELRTRVSLAEADARTRTVYPNPSVAYSYEGAGYNAFIEASQTLPLSGRIRYLRDAGAVMVSVAEANREAALWFLRSDVRRAFFRMEASQERVRLLSGGAREVEQLTVLLRRREEEGEGSCYDRVRAERELAELRLDITSARSFVVADGARLAAYLPEGTQVRQVRGELRAPSQVPELNDLIRRALTVRADYLAEQKSVLRYRIEEQAARRLRIPEPQITAGLKRAEEFFQATGSNSFSNPVQTGFAFSVNVPLPVFNNGRYEVARYQAEQEQAGARIAVLARQIRAEIEGARDVLVIRRDALASYQRELESAGGELTRITQTAYQEGEVGILELLDSLRVNRAASLRLLDLQAGVKEAFIELERAVGEEVRP
jgi:cobalt-zinc-cadmium efflux system outer membrane protein